MAETPVTVPRTPFRYRVAQFLIGNYLRLNGGFEVRGVEHIPADFGAVICPNHVSFLDPPAIGTATPRHTYFMAKKELFKGFFGWAIRRFFAFPVDREGADRNAVRMALEVLQAGNLLTVFPEGGRSPDGSLQAANTGPALFADRAGVAVIPACLKDTDKVLGRGSVFMRRGRVQVDFGQPVYPRDFGEGRLDKDQLKAMMEEIMQRIERLQQEQYARVGQVAPPRAKESVDAQ